MTVLKYFRRSRIRFSTIKDRNRKLVSVQLSAIETTDKGKPEKIIIGNEIAELLFDTCIGWVLFCYLTYGFENLDG